MDTEGKLQAHERECAVRYEQLQGWIKALDKRMWRLEMLMFGNTIVIVSAVVVLLRGRVFEGFCSHCCYHKYKW